ncbi:hypothetical protein [uncultured Nocardioides sp.]|uniref:hypothetical protein n=1 Tax=uncultured Nocardioides sp. TaxID=198441 RepID=UPI0026280243|nr:hypothetical protein [uncultured Nocardioides sp.]
MTAMQEIPLVPTGTNGEAVEATPAELDAYVAHFQARVLQDAMREATATYWRRRAQTFLDARARPGDFLGNSTLEQRRARWCRLTEIAKACEARAQVALIQDDEVIR